jgi:plasmid stabilization system protein ParE
VTFRVRTTRRAEADAEACYDWIADHEGRPLEALQWLVGFEDAIASLAEYPLRCPSAPESAHLGGDVRQLVFHSHRILLVIDGEEVVVLHLRPGSRLPFDGAELDE